MATCCLVFLHNRKTNTSFLQARNFLWTRMSTCQTWLMGFLSRGDTKRWEHAVMGAFLPGLAHAEHPSTPSVKQTGSWCPLGHGRPSPGAARWVSWLWELLSKPRFSFSFLRGNETPIILVWCSHQHENYNVKIFGNDFLIETKKKKCISKLSSFFHFGTRILDSLLLANVSPLLPILWLRSKKSLQQANCNSKLIGTAFPNSYPPPVGLYIEAWGLSVHINVYFSKYSEAIFLVVIVVSNSFMWKSVVHQPSLPCILSRKCKPLPGNIAYSAVFIAQHLIYARFIYFSKQRKQITSACLASSNCVNAVWCSYLSVWDAFYPS